jgi:2',3'-cyclic-nucleotide 2'-phosphodiesterase/3'-nucleotidase
LAKVLLMLIKKKWPWSARAAALAMTLSVLLLSAAVAGSAQAAEVRLRLLETTDLHMNLLAYDYYQDKPTEQYGLARTMTLIKAARQEATNSLLFDNGDLLQGNPMGDVLAKVKPLSAGQMHPAYKLMNALGYDAGNLGNHDFNYGLPFLQQALKGAQFPVLCANVYWDDGDGKAARHAFTPYVLLRRTLLDTAGKPHTLRVGVIGFVPPQIMQWDKAHLQGKLVARDMVAVARELVPRLRAEGAQLVVALPHSGLVKGEVAVGAEDAVSALAQVPGIDALLFGHAHGEFPGPAFADFPDVDLAHGRIHGVPAVMAGKWGDHLGLVDLRLEVSDDDSQWRVTDSQASLRAVAPRGGPVAAADPWAAQALAQEQDDTLAYVRGRITDSTVPLHSYFSQVVDDAALQVVNEAQMAYVRQALRGSPYEGLPLLSAAAPFKSGGAGGWTNYTNMAAGPLAIKNAADLYLYPNTLKALLLTGAQVKEWLEMSAGRFRQIDPQGPAQQELLEPSYLPFNFDVIDGVSYALDLTQPARYDAKGHLRDAGASRVRALRYQGQPVADDQRFVVATNNYRAGGGGNFPGLAQAQVVLDAALENREVLIAYLKTQQPLRVAADGNWRILPVPGVSLRFLSGRAGAQYAGAAQHVRWLQDNGDGSAWFELLP